MKQERLYLYHIGMKYIRNLHNIDDKHKKRLYHNSKVLVEEAKTKGLTEISLDAAQSGRALYSKCGFVDSEECMVLII